MLGSGEGSQTSVSGHDRRHADSNIHAHAYRHADFYSYTNFHPYAHSRPLQPAERQGDGA